MSATPVTSSRLLQERVVSLAQVGRRFPKSRRGKSAHLTPSAVWRWVVHGISAGNGQRIRLEAVFVAGRWLTSLEAIDRFVAAQQPATTSPDPGSPVPPLQSPAARRRAAEQAGLDLERKGK